MTFRVTFRAQVHITRAQSHEAQSAFLAKMGIWYHNNPCNTGQVPYECKAVYKL